MGKGKVLVKLYIDNNSEMIKKWFEQMMLFEPNKMLLGAHTKNKYVKYKKNIFFGKIGEKILDNKFDVGYKDKINHVYCLKNNNSKDIVIYSASIEKDIYKTKEQEIFLLIDDIMLSGGILGRIQYLDDWFWQNHTDVSDYEEKYGSLEGIPLIPNRIFDNEMEVDVEKFPGYGEQIDDLWFGAAWKMWFGEPYYEFVSKEAIENFKDCYKNKQITDNCRCITLYEDMDDYENPENRARQWKFKEAIDFQNVIEKLRETGINRVSDPELEIETGEFAHGGIRLFKGYFDNEGNIVPKSKASKMKLTEHGEDGSVLWEDEQNIL